MAKKFPKADVRVITFAAPRAGNEKFSAAFESLIGTSLRFHFNYDPVPCTPMGWALYSSSLSKPMKEVVVPHGTCACPSCPLQLLFSCQIL